VPAPKQHDDNLLPTEMAICDFHAVNAMGTYSKSDAAHFSALRVLCHQTIPGFAARIAQIATPETASSRWPAVTW
jgi:hypothetical protein